MPPTRLSTRRRFLKQVAAAGTLLAFPTVLRSSALGRDGAVAPSERIAMGSIGVGGQGTGDTRGFLGFPEVRVVAVCDVNKAHRDRAKAMVDAFYGDKGCAACNDFREITRRPDIDAVLVATPDHWHAIPTIEACRHAKDVYCEKPLSLAVREGRAMVEAARRYARVVSGGSQRVIGDHGRLAHYVYSGSLGPVREVYVHVAGPSGPCNLPAEPVPPGLDWDMWLGPAPWAPFNAGRLNFRPWRDYSGGGMTDWGAHHFAGALYALGLEETGPVAVVPPDGKEHPYLTYVFANGVRMYHSARYGRPITYRGVLGDAPGPHQPPPQPPRPMRGYRGRGGIAGDFIHCVKTRERPFRDVEHSHRAATVCHLGNIAYLLGRPLKWDPAREEFVGDDEANRLLDRPKRDPWRL